MSDVDDAAAAAVSVAVTFHLRDVCRSLGLPLDGDIVALKARIVRSAGFETPSDLSEIEGAYAAAAAVFGVKPCAGTLKTRKGSRSRWALWLAMEAHGYGQTDTANRGLFGTRYHPSTVRHGMNQATAIIDLNEDKGKMAEAVKAASQALSYLRNKSP